MITSVRKIIKIGSSEGVTLPVDELKHQGLRLGDKVEVTVRAIRKNTDSQDQAIFDAAKKMLAAYKQDFKNLSQR